MNTPKTEKRGRPRGPKKKHIGVMMPVELWKLVQQHALETGKTLSHIVSDACDEYFGRLDDPAREKIYSKGEGRVDAPKAND